MTLLEFVLARVEEDRRHAKRDYIGSRTILECTAKSLMIEDLTSEHHLLVEDCWYTCPAATEEREGEVTCNDTHQDDSCDCGLDRRIDKRLRIMAAVWFAHPDYQPEWAV